MKRMPILLFLMIGLLGAAAVAKAQDTWVKKKRDK